MKAIFVALATGMLLCPSQSLWAQGTIRRTTPAKPATPAKKTTPAPKKSQPTTGTLSITSTPSDAAVKINGEYMGTTPLTLKDRKAGSYEVTVSAENYDSQTRSITVTAGQTTSCDMTLNRKTPAATTSSTTTTTSTTYSTPSSSSNGCPISDILNPMDGGIILGWTTVEEAVAGGGTNKPREDKDHLVSFGGRDYWDHDGDNVLKSLYFIRSDGVPQRWKQVGATFDLSYSQWLDWLRNHGFEVTVKEAPHTSSGSLAAQIEAVCQSAQLKMELNFNYSNNTSIHANNTLYGIRLKRPNLRTQYTTQSTPQSSSSSSSSVSLPSDGVTMQFLIDHPLGYFSSRNPGMNFQQAFAQLSREHPEWGIENYANDKKSLYINKRPNFNYKGTPITRPGAYWNNSEKLTAHYYTLSQSSAARSDQYLKAMLQELEDLGYTIEKSKSDHYEYHYKCSLNDVEVTISQWKTYNKDLRIRVDYWK